MLKPSMEDGFCSPDELKIVETRKNCHLFGHFDSRGGHTLIQAQNDWIAQIAYMQGPFSWNPKTDCWYTTGMKTLYESDYEGEFELRIVDKLLVDSTAETKELLWNYRYRTIDRGYNMFSLQGINAEGKWEDTNVLFAIPEEHPLTVGKKFDEPTDLEGDVSCGLLLEYTGKYDEDLRLVYRDMGEDAFGVYWYDMMHKTLDLVDEEVS